MENIYWALLNCKNDILYCICFGRNKYEIFFCAFSLGVIIFYLEVKRIDGNV